MTSSAPISEKDLTDRIAEALPMEIRADFYRELRHCRSLPENDEMLRILRVMQFLTLLIHEAPSRLAAERESLEQAIKQCAEALDRTTARLDSLPREIASSIAPDVIAAKVNESLRQQFLQSTIPQTADALAAINGQLKRNVADFQQSSAAIHNAHRNAASEASNAIGEIKRNIESAARESQRATAELKTTFIHEYRWSVGAIAIAALLAGALFMLAYDNWRYSPVTTVPAAVEAQKQKK
jgi:type I site-specific restriction endonuclease